MNKNTYDTPLKERYASKEMLELFSPDKKFSTWRKLWIALAEAEKELGLNITDEQIDQMKEHIYDIDYEYAAQMEKKFRHDVMAHVHAYGNVAPKAMPIIHLGATSCYVGDNADVIIMRDALLLTRSKVVTVLANLKTFALEYKNLPTLGFTHFQPAQLTTVGKRTSLWMQDLMMDVENLIFNMDSLMLLGSKGTTGTQASFMQLFEGDGEKVKKLEQLVAEKLNFTKVQPVSGQTYTRKQDTRVLQALAGIAESAHKMATDIRLLAHMKEVEEPFEKTQIGSSAMAYKRNPMRSERVCSLARYVISLAQNPYYTHSNQWLERTLDDSANKRMSIPEAFLAVDAILELLINISSALVVYEKTVEKHVLEELPFMATENVIMEAVKKGADRQEMHEVIRTHSMVAAKRVKHDGLDNNMITLMAEDSAIPLDRKEIDALLDPAKFVGRAPQQTVEFIKTYIDPLISKYGDLIGKKAEINV